MRGSGRGGGGAKSLAACSQKWSSTGEGGRRERGSFTRVGENWTREGDAKSHSRRQRQKRAKGQLLGSGGVKCGDNCQQIAVVKPGSEGCPMHVYIHTVHTYIHTERESGTLPI